MVIATKNSLRNIKCVIGYATIIIEYKQAFPRFVEFTLECIEVHLSDICLYL